MTNSIKTKPPWWQSTFEKIYLSAFEPLYSEEQTRKEVRWLIRGYGFSTQGDDFRYPLRYRPA